MDEARYIFNTDHSGSSFNKLVRHSLHGGAFDVSTARPLRQRISEKGNLDRVTIMPVDMAAGNSLMLVVIYPGQSANYRYVHDQSQTFLDVLMPCKLQYQEKPAMDSEIFSD